MIDNIIHENNVTKKCKHPRQTNGPNNLHTKTWIIQPMLPQQYHAQKTIKQSPPIQYQLSNTKLWERTHSNHEVKRNQKIELTRQ